jgi:hypothetical protein
VSSENQVDLALREHVAQNQDGPPPTALQKLAAEVLPVSDINAALPHFRRPFTPAAVRWKVQRGWQSGGLVIAYIDARLVIERLNAVVGGAWEEDFAAWGKGMMCKLRVFETVHQDVGMAGQTEPEKAILSDALKRAAVKFGIGVSIYSMAQVQMKVGNARHELGTRQTKDKKTVPDLKKENREWLSEQYARWLAARGESMFGPALDHGDEHNPQGAEEDLEPGETVDGGEAVLPLPDDDVSREFIANARAKYRQLQALDPTAMMPAVFERRLAEAMRNDEQLDLVHELAAQIEKATPK